MQKGLLELFADTPAPRADRHRYNRFATLISKAFPGSPTNQQDINASKRDYFGNIDAARRPRSESTDVSYPRKRPFNPEGESTTSQASDLDESDCEMDELDNLLGIPSPLITEGASLGQYRNESRSASDIYGVDESYLPNPFDLAEENAPNPAELLPNPSTPTRLSPTPISTTSSNDAAIDYANYPTADATLSLKPLPLRTLRQRQLRKSKAGSPIHSSKGKGEPHKELGRQALPFEILNKIQRMANPDTLSILWQYIRGKRAIPLRKPLEVLAFEEAQDSSIEESLSRYQFQYNQAIEGLSNEHRQIASVPRRLYLAQNVNLYDRGRNARRQAPRPKRRRGANKDNGGESVTRSVHDVFVDFLLPQLQDEGTRTEAKRRFENWIQLGRPRAKLVDSFGAGILLLVPQDLSNESLRALTISQEHSLVEYLNDCIFPRLQRLRVNAAGLRSRRRLKSPRCGKTFAT